MTYLFGWTHQDLRDCFLAIIISLAIGLPGSVIIIILMEPGSQGSVGALVLPPGPTRVTLEGQLELSQSQDLSATKTRVIPFALCLDLHPDTNVSGALYHADIHSLRISEPDGRPFFAFTRVTPYDHRYHFGDHVSPDQRSDFLSACAVDLNEDNVFNDASILSEPLEFYISAQGALHSLRPGPKTRLKFRESTRGTLYGPLVRALQSPKLLLPPLLPEKKESARGHIINDIYLDFRCTEECPSSHLIQASSKAQSKKGEIFSASFKLDPTCGKITSLHFSYLCSLADRKNGIPLETSINLQVDFHSESLDSPAIADAPTGEML